MRIVSIRFISRLRPRAYWFNEIQANSEQDNQDLIKLINFWSTYICKHCIFGDTILVCLWECNILHHIWFHFFLWVFEHERKYSLSTTYSLNCSSCIIESYMLKHRRNVEIKYLVPFYGQIMGSHIRLVASDKLPVSLPH